MLADSLAQRCSLHPESRGSTTRVRPAMATEFNGKIDLDIRDSEPDWGPFAAPTAPEGAPNVLYLVWDATGIIADRPQRHHRGHGHHRGIHRRVPELQWSDSGRHRAALRGTRRTWLQHLLRWQMAPDATRRVQYGVDQAALAYLTRLRTVLRILGRRDRPMVSRPGVRQPSGEPARSARGRLPPVEGHRRQDNRIHPRRQGDSARQAMVQL